MALIKCPECGKEISSEAKFCPGCGKPQTKPKGTPLYKSGVFWAFVVGGIIAAALVIYVIVGFNQGVEEYRQSDEYKEMQQIIEDSERMKENAKQARRDLEEVRNEYEYYFGNLD